MSTIRLTPVIKLGLKAQKKKEMKTNRNKFPLSMGFFGCFSIIILISTAFLRVS